jgi:hypothetical protein
MISEMIRRIDQLGQLIDNEREAKRKERVRLATRSKKIVEWGSGLDPLMEAVVLRLKFHGGTHQDTPILRKIIPDVIRRLEEGPAQA